MSKGMLTQQEYDALMELFDSAQHPPRKDKAVSRQKRGHSTPEIIKNRCEALASEWSEELASLTGQTASVRLRTIVKKGMIDIGEEETLYQSGERAYIVFSASLVNFVNEQRLGAQELIPQLMHPLTQIDRQLFEQTGALFSKREALTLVETPPLAPGWIEAGFDVEIAPFLRTTLRWVSHEPV